MKAQLHYKKTYSTIFKTDNNIGLKKGGINETSDVTFRMTSSRKNE